MAYLGIREPCRVKSKSIFSRFRLYFSSRQDTGVSSRYPKWCKTLGVINCWWYRCFVIKKSLFHKLRIATQVPLDSFDLREKALSLMVVVVQQ